MNKYLICTDADEDSGKSATLLCLIRMLEAQNVDKLEAFPHNEEEAKEYQADRTVAFQMNNHLVLIQSQGDPGTHVFADTKAYLEKNEPRIIICAARPNGEPMKQARENAAGYTFIHFQNYRSEQPNNYLLNNQLNRLSAESLLSAIHELLKQLDSKGSTINAIKLFVEAFSNSLPTGKINTFANQTLPSLLIISLRKDRPVNLVSAFEKPVRTKGGYLDKSIERLANEFKKVDKFVEEPLISMYINTNEDNALKDIGEEEASLKNLTEDLGKKLEELL